MATDGRWGEAKWGIIMLKKELVLIRVLYYKLDLKRHMRVGKKIKLKIKQAVTHRKDLTPASVNFAAIIEM